MGYGKYTFTCCSAWKIVNIYTPMVTCLCDGCTKPMPKKEVSTIKSFKYLPTKFCFPSQRLLRIIMAGSSAEDGISCLVSAKCALQIHVCNPHIEALFAIREANLQPSGAVKGGSDT